MNDRGLELERWVKVAVVLSIAACLLAGQHQAFGVSVEDVSTAITDGQRSLQMAFVNVLGAEGTWVNVSSFLVRLNAAGSDLTVAEVDLSNGNFSEAISQAVACKALADSVASDAASAKSQAGGKFATVFPVLIGGIISSVLLVVFLALIWLWFKRYYTRTASKSRPKVTV